MKADIKELDLLSIVDFLCDGYKNNIFTLKEIKKCSYRDIAIAVINDCYEMLKEKAYVFDDDELSLYLLGKFA